MDGNHRVIEGIQAGKTSFDVVLDEYVPDMERTAGNYDSIIASAVQMVPEIKKNLTSKKKLEEAVAPEVVQPEKETVANSITAKAYPDLFTQTPAFKAWFKKSKVVDADGKPLRVYHGTSVNKDFLAFKRRPGDVGIHFGTTGQANDRVSYLTSKQGAQEHPDKRPRTFPVYLSIQNPLRLTDLGTWRGDNLFYALKNHARVQRQSLQQSKLFSNESGDRAGWLRWHRLQEYW